MSARWPGDLLKRFSQIVMEASQGPQGSAATSAPSSLKQPVTKNGNGAKPADDTITDLVKEQLSKNRDAPLSICVFGASGDLAYKKIFPALFALYYQDLLPPNIAIFGFARTGMTDEEFRQKITSNLTCRIDFKENCDEKMQRFLDGVHYVAGGYGDENAFKKLSERMTSVETKHANRIFYLSLPPSLFVDAARGIKQGSMAPSGWTRVIVEKPFGRDSESSKELNDGLAKYLKEEQIYRIDHYLAKELVQNLIVLRFANLVFEPFWNRSYIDSVQITFKEDFGTDGRGGYFDQYGIIRDIIQNHLLQILALVAMEQPVSLSAEDVRDEKVKVLRSMRPMQIGDIATGQYVSRKVGGRVVHEGYRNDPTVDPNSITPTFAAAVMHINNRRWDGVPFLLKAGKALDERKTEIRIKFKHVPGYLWGKPEGVEIPRNELVIQVQPDERIYLRVMNKVPGLGMNLEESDLDLQYKARFQVDIPDAYERLILDVCNGDKSLFIRGDELEAAWALFTPVLHLLEKERIKPKPYVYGSTGPAEAAYLAAKHRVKWSD